MLRSHKYWLGGLFNPEAFITATRQCIAQANSWSLEDLKLELKIYEDEDSCDMDESSFKVEKMKLIGAEYEGHEALKVSQAIFTDLKILRLRWVHAADGGKGGNTSVSAESGKFSLPVYLNSTRSHLLFHAEFDLCQGQTEQAFTELSIAIVANL